MNSVLVLNAQSEGGDLARHLQVTAASEGVASWGHWGLRRDQYSEWGSHSNRLIPVYTQGIAVRKYVGPHSKYRSEKTLNDLYGYVPVQTVNSDAMYMDQTDIYRMQMDAVNRGKRYVFLVIFDGMDRTTADAAEAFLKANHSRSLSFREGSGRHKPIETEMVTSPSYGGATTDVNKQVVEVKKDTQGGFNPGLGATGGTSEASLNYLTGRYEPLKHAYTDSASSATSMMAGVKTYNGAINVLPNGQKVEPIGRTLQSRGYRTGIVTSVPISHATPAAAYAHNVSRNDYQDLSRDLFGLPSVANSKGGEGLDVIIGAGYSAMEEEDERQGDNYQPGNRYLTNQDMSALRDGDKYHVVTRQSGMDGTDILLTGAMAARIERKKFFGYFGTKYAHLPYRTADGGFDAVQGGDASRYAAEEYTEEDVKENPTLTEMTSAAIALLSAGDQPFWLMVEAGDVDWANHGNNIDNSIGAVISGLDAYEAIVHWIELNNAWRESAIIVTADHGHLLVIHDFSVFGK